MRVSDVQMRVSWDSDLIPAALVCTVDALFYQSYVNDILEKAYVFVSHESQGNA